MGNTVQITLEVDDKGTVKVKQFADETKKTFDEMKKGPEAAKGPLDSLGGSWVGLTAKVTVATGVIYGVTRAIGSFVSEAAEAEDIQNRLRFAAESTGNSWGALKDRVDAFGKSILETTRFSDEDAKRALTDMFLYTTQYEKAQQGATLAMDLAVRKGMDLSSATRYIGMAMTGNIEMLGRMLPEFRNLNDVIGENATLDEKAAYALKIFNEKFTGAAPADIETYTGKLEQFRNQWRKFKEELGEGLLPVLGAVVEKLTELMKKKAAWEAPKGEVESFLGEETMRYLAREGGGYNKEEVRGEFGGMPIPAGSRTETLDPFVKKYGMSEAELRDRLSTSKLLGEGWVQEYNRMAEIEENLKKIQIEQNQEIDYSIEAIHKATVEAAAFRDRIKESETEMAKMWAATERWNTEGGYQVFGYEAGGFLDSYAGKLKQIEDETNKYGDTIKSFGSTLSSSWSTNLTQMIKGAESFSDGVKNIFAGMGDSVIATISKMATNWLMFGSLTGEKGGTSFGGTTGGYGGIIGGIGSIIKLFGDGGIVTRPTPAIVGESGPEAVIPLKDGKVPIKGGGEMIQVNNYISIPEPGQFNRAYGPIVKKLSLDAVAEAKRYGGGKW